MEKYLKKKIFWFSLVLLALPILMAGYIMSPSGAEERGPGRSIPAITKFTFPGDWNKVPTKWVTLFYPGQANWEFLTSSDHPGRDGIVAGIACASCHQGQEKALGARLVNNPRLEPDPIQGKKPSVELQVRAAYDKEYIYFQFQWESAEPGVTHTLWRYDGKKWVKWGGPKPDVTKQGTTPSYENRLAVILGQPGKIPAYDGAKASFSQVGCFATCHASMRAMPKEPSSQAVKADPYFGESGKKRSDIRKYLLITRSALDETGGWNKVKDQKELERLHQEGRFLDLWQWRASRSGPLGYAGDDHVFDYRWFDKGKNMFTDPAEAKWMYDAKVTGFNAIPERELNNHLQHFPLIIGENAVPLDPKAEFKVGDILPRPVLQRPTESVADVLANSFYSAGKWTVELRRRLATGQPDDIVLRPGASYDIGLAIFDDYVSNRRHYVILPPLTLGLGVEAGIRAVELR